MKKTKIRKLLNRLEPGSLQLDKVLKDTTKQLKSAISSKTAEEANEKFRVLRKSFKEIYSLLDAYKGEFSKTKSEIADYLNSEIDILNNSISSVVVDVKKSAKSADVRLLELQLQEVSDREMPRIPDFGKDIKALEEMMLKRIGGIKFPEQKIPKPFDPEPLVKEFDEKLKQLRIKLMSMAQPGGQANRNISIGGNSSVLSKYTDLNIKPGANITLTYTNNDTTKNLDLTITSSGGGSSVAGTTREINTVIVSSVIGSVAGIDYVTLCNAGLKATLPTAVGNTNLYTVKNIAASSVLIATNASETIDGEAEIIMPIQYTAVDLISDNANWHIT